MPNYLSRWRDRLRRRVRAWITQTHELRGLRVVVENTRLDVDTTIVVRRLDEALGLIETYQPWRLRHLRRDVDQIWVVRYPCRGAYFPESRTCMTELTFLARTEFSPAQIAASIVHEGVHARIHRRGVKHDGRDAAREERICRRAEIDFGRALPGDLGAPVLRRAEAAIAATDEEVAPAVDWTEAHLKKDLADIEALGLPDWVKRRLIARRRRRAQASKAGSA